MGNYHIRTGYKLLTNLVNDDKKPNPETIFIETTITSIANYHDDALQITCYPPLFNRESYEKRGCLHLLKNNKNFNELHNKLKLNNTYKFEFINFVDGGLNIILNVMEVDTYRIHEHYQNI